MSLARWFNLQIAKPLIWRAILLSLGAVVLMGLLTNAVVTLEILRNIVVTLFMVSVIVGIHELCHLLVARALSIEVHAFAIGFGPQLFSVNWARINWAVRALPLGGFVKLKGEDTDEGPHSFSQAAQWKKVVIMLAGPISNLVLAVGVLTALFVINGAPLLQAPAQAWDLLALIVSKTVEVVAQMLPVMTVDPLQAPVVGYPGLVAGTGELMAGGLNMMFVLFAVISASVGLSNLLPIPPLDGGQAALVVAKSILRDRYPDKLGVRIQMAGLTFLVVTFMILPTILDVVRMILGRNTLLQ